MKPSQGTVQTGASAQHTPLGPTTEPGSINVCINNLKHNPLPVKHRYNGSVALAGPTTPPGPYLHGLCGEGLHDPPHVEHELADILADLAPMEDEGVGDGGEGLLLQMVGLHPVLLLVFGLKAQEENQTLE